MDGKIIKGIAGFYYVHVVGSGIYECKAKGIFRKKNIKPLVGDNVTIEVGDEVEKTGNIIDIHPRENQLIRPAVANIDQAILIFAVTRPNPHFNLLDRFLVMMERQDVETIICFNKTDIGDPDEIQILADTYSACGYKVIFTSAYDNDGLEEIQQLIKGKTSALAGPSGVGKSSIINILQPEISMETGAISKKIGRGKHTTRHSQLIYVSENTYIMDTPGFSSLLAQDLEKEELRNYFPEFHQYEGQCKFQGCVHMNEPSCAVKDALNAGDISQSRYDNYVIMFEEAKNYKRY